MPTAPKTDARVARARREKALARAELRGPSTPRVSASGPISFPVKARDLTEDAMVGQFLAQETSIYVVGTVIADAVEAPCKIGISSSVAKRVKSIQVGSAREIRLFRHFRLPSRRIALSIERDFHQLFAGHRLSGEWFRLTPEAAAEKLTELIREQVSALETIEPWQRSAALDDARVRS